MRENCLYSVIQWRRIVCHYKLYLGIFHEACLFSYYYYDYDTSKYVGSSRTLRWKNINNFLLLKPMKGVALANADIFLLAFLRKSVRWLLKFKFTSVFTPNSFSHLLYILITTGLFVLTNTWHLSLLLFKRLFLNQLNINKESEACSKDATTLILFSL